MTDAAPPDRDRAHHCRLRQLRRGRHPGRPQDVLGLRRLRRLGHHGAHRAEHARRRGRRAGGRRHSWRRRSRPCSSDLEVGAIKTGMLANAGIVEAVARRLRDGPRRPLVVDPVMVATSGDVLLEPDAVDALKRELFPLATLITPNLPEAARLLGARGGRERGRDGRAGPGAARARLPGGAPQGRARQRRGRRSTSCAMAPASSASCARASTRATRTAPAARFRPPSRPCWRRAWRCGRPSAAPRRSCGRRLQAGARARRRARQRAGRPPVRHPPLSAAGLTKNGAIVAETASFDPISPYSACMVGLTLPRILGTLRAANGEPGMRSVCPRLRRPPRRWPPRAMHAGCGNSASGSGGSPPASTAGLPADAPGRAGQRGPACARPGGRWPGLHRRGPSAAASTSTRPSSEDQLAPSYERTQGASGEQLANIEKSLRRQLQETNLGRLAGAVALPHRPQGSLRHQGRPAAPPGRRSHRPTCPRPRPPSVRLLRLPHGGCLRQAIQQHRFLERQKEPESQARALTEARIWQSTALPSWRTSARVNLTRPGTLLASPLVKPRVSRLGGIRLWLYLACVELTGPAPLLECIAPATTGTPNPPRHRDHLRPHQRTLGVRCPRAEWTDLFRRAGQDTAVPDLQLELALGQSLRGGCTRRG